MKRPLFAASLLLLPLVASADPVISEFMANNVTGLQDEDGQRGDWIEVHNPDSTPVNLAGWHLTDKSTNLSKWTFPAVTVAPKGFLLVWATEKNRAVAGSELHTNFKLDASGEYLALTRPDNSVAHEFAPLYPQQAPDVAYGVPVTEQSVVLASQGSSAKVKVPSDDSAAAAWRDRAYDDSAWTSREAGVGFDNPVPPVAESSQWADSVSEFSGTQGQNNWSYGYWNRTADVDKLYTAGDVTLFLRDGTNTVSATNHWNGGNWDINGAASAPWTEMTSGGGHPNGINSGAEHWTVRRYVSEFTGTARLVGTLADGAECGDGVALRIYVDGVQVYFRPTFSSTPLEFTAETEVQAGQNVDFVIDPLANDGCDGHAFSVKVLSNSLADSVADWTAGGLQTSRNWSYGYYRRSGDADGVYQTANFTAFPRATGNAVSGTNAWNGTNWQLTATTPVTALSATGGTPAVTGATDWPARRWTSTYSGRVRIAGTVGHLNAGGDGITGRIYVDGSPVFSRSVNNLTEGYSVVVNVAAGSVVDFLMDPNTTETGDAGAVFTAVIGAAGVGTAITADSITGFGTGAQGTNGWSYGYYNKTDDPNGTYADADFNSTDANWTLSGGTWVLGPGDPPWTFENARGGHPNGTNSGGKEHWAIRRWTSTVSGPVTVDYNLSKMGAGGGGTTVKVFHNGAERASAAIAGTDRAGIARSVVLENVAVGDRIDVALTPVGSGGDTADGSDGSYFSARVLYNTIPANVTVSKVADSSEDWSTSGTQGYRGWNYGYYNKTTDTDGVYQAANFSAFLRDGSNTVSAANHWNGSMYDLNPAASGPWTELGQESTHPNGTNSAPGHEQWTIRRWVSNQSGPLSVSYKVWKTNPNGGGVSIRAFHNGAPMDTVAIAGNDSAGVTRTFGIPSAAVGDVIDVALTPVGLSGGTDDGSDGSAFRVTINKVVPFSDCIDASAGNIAAQMSGVNATAYVRLPVSVPAGAAYDKLKLRMKFDDGFVAWINGTEVARRNAPEAAAGGFFADSVAEFSGTQGQNNWFYGYYNSTADTDGKYSPGDLNTADPNWTGAWALGPGDPPWTSLWNTGGHPNGPNNGANQQPIRRWVAESAGTLTAHLRIAKTGVCDTGTTGILYHNGTIVWQKAVGGTDTVGQWADVQIPGVQIGDSIDLAIDARGTDGGTNDFCDATTLTMTIDQQPSPGLTWNSSATATRATADAGTPVEFDLTAQRFALVAGAGDNVLAIHGLNRRAGDPDFLLAPELIASVITANPAGRVYFTSPTPGGTNGDGSANIGPVITQVTDSPPVTDADNITVTARVTRTLDPIGTVTLFYRVMYGPEASVVMLDDGLNGDSLAGDGIYGALIPAAASAPGEMVRWRITATDSTNDLTKSPPYTNPSNSPEYWGTVVSVPNPVAGGQLPVLHWFTANPSAHDGAGGGRCAVFFNGQFFDNVGADLHGQSSSGFPKKSYDFDLNTGFKMQWDLTPNNSSPKVNSFNLLTTYPDKANLRNILSYRTFAAAGVPGHWAQAVQVRRNNAFYSVAHMVEDGDSDYLQRAPGLNDQGALYKMYNTFYDPSGGEKKSRKWEGNQDLSQFMAGLATTGGTRERFLYDNTGIPETINYLTAQILTGNDDCCHKNYYVYRDSEGNREWRPLPWDVDLSYGRVWRSPQGYYLDTMTTNTSLYVGQGNQFMTPFSDNSVPALRQMYLRRLRTLADTILQQSSVPPAGRWVENQLTSLQALVQPDADYERSLNLWGTWGTPQTMAQAVDIIRNDYLNQRRTYVFSQPELPASQDPLITVNFGTVVFDPASHNQAEEYFTLVNPNAVAVDVSGWVISGAVNHTLKPGTVIPAGGTLYLSPDVNAFRARTVSPKGNEGLFVQGDYNGQLSARGETLTLMDGTRTVATLTYSGAPTAAQSFLRVTEMMYNPGPKPGDTFDKDEYEFIELKNISASTAVPLSGVKFSNGVAFTFAAGTLNAGERAVLVRNPAAFVERFPSVTAAGTYTGSLDNAGERVVLLDASNEEVLDYSYEDDWYPATDGGGFTLVCADENQAPDLWTLKIGWRPSGTVCGTPGAPDSVSDTDGDGLDDYAEWLGGTNPFSGQSIFTATPAGFAPGGAYSGSFPALGGRTYTVQWSATLENPSWTKLQDFAPVADGAVTFIDPASITENRRFYRVLTPATP